MLLIVQIALGLVLGYLLILALPSVLGLLKKQQTIIWGLLSLLVGVPIFYFGFKNSPEMILKMSVMFILFFVLPILCFAFNEKYNVKDDPKQFDKGVKFVFYGLLGALLVIMLAAFLIGSFA